MENIKTFEEFHDLNESIDLRKYIGPSYKDYEHGDPDKAAAGLIKLIAKFRIDAQKELDKAGSFLSPAIKVAMEKEMSKAIREIKAK